MAHVDTVETPRTNWRLISSWSAFVAILLVAYFFGYQDLYQASNADAFERNPGMDTSSWLMIGAIAGSIIWVVVFLVAAIIGEKNENHWFAKLISTPLEAVEEMTDEYISWAVTASLPLAIIPVACAFALTLMPYNVTTPQGFVRITDTNQAFSSGEVFRSERGAPHSVLVGLNQTVTISHAVDLAPGYHVRVTIVGVRRLDEHTVGDYIRNNASAFALGLGRNPAREQGYVAHNDQVVAQNHYFSTTDVAHINRMIEQVVREAAQTGTMSNTGMLLRLGELIEQNRSAIPAWEASLTVGSLSVQGWTLTK